MKRYRLIYPWGVYRDVWADNDETVLPWANAIPGTIVYRYDVVSVSAAEVMIPFTDSDILTTADRYTYRLRSQ